MTEPLIAIVFAAQFLKDAKALRKRYRHIDDDVREFTEELKQGKTPGDRLQKIPGLAYKARVPNRDAQRGKSGGYRVIYYVKTAERIALITIYSKSDQEDVPDALIIEAIQEVLDDETRHDD